MHPCQQSQWWGNWLGTLLILSTADYLLNCPAQQLNITLQTWKIAVPGPHLKSAWGMLLLFMACIKLKYSQAKVCSGCINTAVSINALVTIRPNTLTAQTFQTAGQRSYVFFFGLVHSFGNTHPQNSCRKLWCHVIHMFLDSVWFTLCESVIIITIPIWTNVHKSVCTSLKRQTAVLRSLMGNHHKCKFSLVQN